MRYLCRRIFAKNVFLSTIILICLFLSCVSKNKLNFERFEEIERLDTTISKGVQLIKKEEYYLVSGYRNNKKADAQIDSFFCSVKDFNSEKYYTHWVHFLRKSKKMNKEYFQAYERGFYMDFDSQDRIVSYRIENLQIVNKSGFAFYKETGKGNQNLVSIEKFDCNK